MYIVFLLLLHCQTFLSVDGNNYNTLLPTAGSFTKLLKFCELFVIFFTFQNLVSRFFHLSPKRGGELKDPGNGSSFTFALASPVTVILI